MIQSIPVQTMDQNYQHPKIKLGPKLFLAMAVLIAITSMLMGFGLHHISAFQQILLTLNRDNVQMQLAANINQHLLRIAQIEKNCLLTDNAFMRMEYKREADTLTAQLKEQFKQLQNFTKSIGADQRLRLFATQMTTFLQTNQQILQLSTTGQIGKATELFQREGEESLNAAAEMMRAVVDVQDGRINRNIQKQQKNVTELLEWSITLTCAGTLFSIAIYLFIIIKRIRPQLLHATNEVTTIADQILLTMQQNEQRVSQQAIAVTQLSATTHELGTSVHLIAQQAQSATTQSEEALRISAMGKQVIQETLLGMEALKNHIAIIAHHLQHLNEQTQQIDNITDMVTDFVNETKILAMNAAVEAVRAKEHGKGFSILAIEIRKLADESKRSTARIIALNHEIRQATHATVQATTHGKQSVEQWTHASQHATNAFLGVTEALEQSSNRGEQIALNINQVKTGINQVIDAITILNNGFKESVDEIKQNKQGMHQLNIVAHWVRSLI